ncbi:succinylglutamate desuccinylase [Aestuariibacter halophilus]|uniref:Succinylglutamate desuccinylase n=1 Tax=Fluctibacter halophilus TaxID=226011 RepID=A0ABS8G7A4_9ALTE|nr:succinylglutamate desuccinylase [Aestuariibacter halophilus]MCC2616001.1 succinylglutamate desuccinylase [Aestuariibacter halophilus]
MIEQSLQQQGGFLARSRTTPDDFSSPLQFTLNNGTQVDISAEGIIAFTPAQPGDKDIVLSCGVHGNETAPIEICDEMVDGILTGKLNLAHRVLFLFGNLPAMDIAQRFVEENMNRLFSGAHSEAPGLVNAERRRAKQLEDAVEAFYASAPEGNRTRYHYDLHTAIRASKNDKFAVYPLLHDRQHSIEQIRFLGACGVTTILLSESPTTTFSYFSSTRFNAHAFTVELGKVRPFGENDMQRFAAAKDSLTRLVSGQPVTLPAFDERFLVYRVNQVINRTKEDFRLNFDDDTPNFTDYKQGDVLAEESGAVYRATQDGEAIVFPNANVALGQRALLTVVPTRLEP